MIKQPVIPVVEVSDFLFIEGYTKHTEGKVGHLFYNGCHKPYFSSLGCSVEDTNSYLQHEGHFHHL